MTLAVLAGGRTLEKEISLITAREVLSSLNRLGYEAQILELSPKLFTELSLLRPNLAFIATHGTPGEDGCLQGALEMLKIKYTHSGILGSAIAMDKWVTKQIASNILDIPVPPAIKASKQEIVQNPCPMQGKFIIKPNTEGSSINLFSFTNRHDFTKSYYPFTGEVLIEEFISGIELHAALIKGEFAGAIEIKMKNGSLYDFDSKYLNDNAVHIKPPNIGSSVLERLKSYSVKIYDYLGCKGIGRADFIYDPERDTLFLLEFNTHPGLTPKSLVPEIAKFYLDMNFDTLIDAIIGDVE